MLTAIILTIAVITPSSRPAAPAPAASSAVPMPMTTERWHMMTHQQHLRYAAVTIDAARHSPAMARCTALAADALVSAIEKNTHPHEPLMMAVAAGLYDLCPE